MDNLFSNQSKQYAAFRPNYPTTLIDYVVSLCNEKENVWDFGTGNGQVATALVPFFQNITASDVSAEQLKYAPRHPQINYINCPAEKSVVKRNSMDLITVAEAFHWFDSEAFFHRINCGLKLNGVLAIWSYGNLQSDNSIINLVDEFRDNTLKHFWHANTQNTQSNPFLGRTNFSEFNPPPFFIVRSWDILSLIGYIESWSATNLFKLKNPAQFNIFKKNISGAFYPELIRFYWEIKLYVGRKIG